MRVERIHIRNILGTEALDIAPGKLTVISGKNASGKTSVLEAIKSIPAGGHDATLLRNGADEGEVVLVLDDRTEIRKTITRSGSNLHISDPTRGTMSAPQSFVARITDKLGINPVAFLTAKPKDRLTLLLEAMPLTVAKADLEEATEGTGFEIADVTTDAHALVVLGDIRKGVYDARTGINRAAKEKKGTMKQLYDAIEVVRAPDEVAAKLEKASAHVEGLRSSRQEALDAAKAAYEAAVSAAQEAWEQAKAEANTEFEPKIEEAAASVSTLTEQLRTSERMDNSRATVEKMGEQLEGLEQGSSAHTEALDRLDALKAALLENLPVQGVTIEDGELHVDGVPFDRVNTAKQVSVAMKVAMLRYSAPEQGSSLPLVCVDGLELLDEAHFHAFRKWAEGADAQLIVTRVSDDEELTITTNDEVTA